MSIVDLLFSFAGRINRAKFWLGLLIINVVAAAALFAALAMQVDVLAAKLVMGLVVLYPALAVAAKRFHDRGNPGLLAILLFVPLLNLLTLLYLGFAPGQPGANAYGADPLA